MAGEQSRGPGSPTVGHVARPLLGFEGSFRESSSPPCKRVVYIWGHALAVILYGTFFFFLTFPKSESNESFVFKLWYLEKASL